MHVSPAPLAITFRVDAFSNRGKAIRCVGGACVWGMGAYLTVQGEFVARCVIKLGAHDEAALDIVVGDDRAQQAAEALRLLVALRPWKQVWSTERAALEVRGDNVAALTLVLHLKGKGLL